MSPFVSESFQTDLATGAATMSVPITVPPGRKNMQPNVGLSYSSNNSNGLCGVGWAIPVNLIQRSTKDGVPGYIDSDTFIFASGGANAELVSVDPGGLPEGQSPGVYAYRPRIEGAFMKYIYDSNVDSWTVYDKSGTKYLFGSSADSRLGKTNKTFGWYLDRAEDVYGNYITYTYDKPEDGQIYPAEISYTGGNGLVPDKTVVFNYIENRPDKQYSYRSGWRIATTRLLSSMHVKLGGELQWRYELAYTTSQDTGRSLLDKVTVYDKAGNFLPPKTFTYSRLE